MGTSYAGRYTIMPQATWQLRSPPSDSAPSCDASVSSRARARPEGALNTGEEAAMSAGVTAVVVSHNSAQHLLALGQALSMSGVNGFRHGSIEAAQGPQ